MVDAKFRLMASSVVLRRRIYDITQCPICLDKFDIPTSLPCLHTFCLRCLQSTFATDCPGDVATCPLCRQDFQLPAGGVNSLPRNFTLGDLLELRTTARPTSAPPSVYVTLTEETTLSDESLEDEMTTLKMGESNLPATGDTTGSEDCQPIECSLSASSSPHHDGTLSSGVSTEDVTTTTVCDKHTDAEDVEFCFDCRVDVCGACCDDAHQDGTLSSGVSAEDITTTTTCDKHTDAEDVEDGTLLSPGVSTEDVMTTTVCDKHTDAEDVEFCFDCRVDVCGVCCDDVHRRHRRRRQNEVIAECRRRVAYEMARVTDALNDTYIALFDVDQRRADILRELRQKEELARKECNAEDVNEVRKRLRALSAEKDSDLRQLAGSKARLDVNQTSLETFLKAGAQRMATATTTRSLLRIVKELKKEAKSLLSVHQTRLDRAKLDGKQQTSLTGIHRPVN